MKSKKALARRAAQEAEAAKLAKVEDYKAHYRQVFGFEPRDQVAIELAATSIPLPDLRYVGDDHQLPPINLPRRTMSVGEWAALHGGRPYTTQEAQHDHMYQEHPPCQLTAQGLWERQQRTLHGLIGGLTVEGDQHTQTVRAFAQLGRNWERFAERLIRDPINIPSFLRPATSQHVDSPTPTGRSSQPQPQMLNLMSERLTSRSSSYLTGALAELLSSHELENIELFDDMVIITTPCDPLEDV